MTDTPVPALEDRVAALEDLVAHPLMAADAFTGEQEAELRASLDALGQDGKPFEYRVLPPHPLLTPETARALLRECVTVVRPGETLIVRAHEHWTPQQVRELQDYADTVTEYRDLGVKILFVPGEEFAVAQPKPEPLAFPGDVRVDVFRDGTAAASFRLTHLPTGLTAEGPTRDAAADILSRKLAEYGGVSVNTIRALVRLPPFAKDFELHPRDPRR